MATSVMQVRVDDELKAQAAAIYEDPLHGDQNVLEADSDPEWYPVQHDPSKEGLQSGQGRKSHV